MKQFLLLSLVIFKIFILDNMAFAQGGTCGTAVSLGSAGVPCTQTTYNVSATATGVTSSCGAGTEEGWYTFTATSSETSISATTDRNLAITVYSGACGSLTQIDCVNDFGGGTAEAFIVPTVAGTTYRILLRRQTGTAGTMNGTICVTANRTTTTSCSSTFTDSGGSGGNYMIGEYYTRTFCPSSAGQYVSINFSAFSLESGFDFMWIFNGASASSEIIGSYTGTTSPGTVTSSHPDGCLTVSFYSDNDFNDAGFNAAVSCSVTPGTPPTTTASTNCSGGGGTTVCGNTTLSANSSGAGVDELVSSTFLSDNSPWNGCLIGGENQSSWYYFSPSAPGNVAFTISPTTASDDYDFAIWGPYSAVECPAYTFDEPIRCSYSSATGNTGLLDGSGDFSENDLGNKFVEDLVVSAGQVYILLIDNFSNSGNPFNLTWNLTGGASLDCTVLPVELLQFNGYNQKSKNTLLWSTAAETNSSYFDIEHSVDGRNFTSIGRNMAAGNSATILKYEFIHSNPTLGKNYYRLKQVDFDGKSIYSGTLQITNTSDDVYAGNVFPNPSGNNFNLMLQSKYDDAVQLHIYSITGMLIATQQFQVQEKKDNLLSFGAELPKGSYMVVVEDSKHNIISNQRIIKL